MGRAFRTTNGETVFLSFFLPTDESEEISCSRRMRKVDPGRAITCTRRLYLCFSCGPGALYLATSVSHAEPWRQIARLHRPARRGSLRSRSWMDWMITQSSHCPSLSCLLQTGETRKTEHWRRRNRTDALLPMPLLYYSEWAGFVRFSTIAAILGTGGNPTDALYNTKAAFLCSFSGRLKTDVRNRPIIAALRKTYKTRVWREQFGHAEYLLSQPFLSLVILP